MPIDEMLRVQCDPNADDQVCGDHGLELAVFGELQPGVGVQGWAARPGCEGDDKYALHFATGTHELKGNLLCVQFPALHKPAPGSAVVKAGGAIGATIATVAEAGACAVGAVGLVGLSLTAVVAGGALSIAASNGGPFVLGAALSAQGFQTSHTLMRRSIRGITGKSPQEVTKKRLGCLLALRAPASTHPGAPQAAPVCCCPHLHLRPARIGRGRLPSDPAARCVRQPRSL